MAELRKMLLTHFVNILQASGDKICLLHVYFDRLEMMSQLDVLPGQK